MRPLARTLPRTVPLKDMAIDRYSIEALKNMIEEVDDLISTADPLPQNRTPRCRCPSLRRSRSQTNLHVNRGAPEPYDPHVHAPPHEIDECAFQEVGQPVGRILPTLRLLQLLPDSQDAPRHACHGSGDCGLRVGS